jgi:hypothetical protein
MARRASGPHMYKYLDQKLGRPSPSLSCLAFVLAHSFFLPPTSTSAGEAPGLLTRSACALVLPEEGSESLYPFGSQVLPAGACSLHPDGIAAPPYPINLLC